MSEAPTPKEAIAWLNERGKVLGVDFISENAIKIANEISFIEECERRDKGDGPIDFDGQNCDECDGWTPGNRRCDCGNRRVSWSECYGHSFKDPQIYAEAY